MKSFTSIIWALTMLLSTAALSQNVCDNLPGEWKWFKYGNVIINPDGTHSQGDNHGTWRCSGSTVTMVWSHGYIDELQIGSGGTSLSGKGWKKGNPGRKHDVSGSQLSSFTSNSGNNFQGKCADIPGHWNWFANGPVTINADGTFSQDDVSGTWSCSGSTVTMIWSHGFTDKLNLSDDGNRLSGEGWKNGNPGRKHKVSGTRRSGSASNSPLDQKLRELGECGGCSNWIEISVSGDAQQTKARCAQIKEEISKGLGFNAFAVYFNGVCHVCAEGDWTDIKCK